MHVVIISIVSIVSIVRRLDFGKRAERPETLTSEVRGQGGQRSEVREDTRHSVDSSSSQTSSLSQLDRSRCVWKK